MRNALLPVLAVVLLSTSYYTSGSRPETIGFLIEDPAGDRMVIIVNSSRKEVVEIFAGMLSTGERKWIGGEIVRDYGVVFGFRFKPDTVSVSDVTAEGLQAVYFKTIQENITYWKGFGAVYISGKVIHILSLSQEDARFRAETNRDFIMFWAVLFFTCVVGIVETLHLLKPESEPRKIDKILLLVLYLILLGGMALSIYSAFNTYQESARLTRFGELGEGYRQYVDRNPTFTDYFILEWYAEVIRWMIITLIVTVFSLLYCAKTGLLVLVDTIRLTVY